VREPWPLPSDWRWSEWKDVARVASNLVNPADFQDHPHIAPNHIESGTGRLLPYQTVRDDGVTSSKHLFKPGQLLYSKIRPYLAKAVVVDFGGLCSADMYPVDTELDHRYLKWWMLSPDFTRFAAGEQARTVLPKINKDALGRLPVPVPPVAEQHRIVDLLEDHLSRLDAAEALVRKSIRRQAALRDAALYDWVQRARESAGVELATLGSIAKVTSGLTPLKANKAFYEGGTIPWITSGDLHQGVVTKASTFVTERALADTTLKMVPAGALLIAMYGEGKTRGTAAELGFDATTNQACAAVVLHDPNLRQWVRLVLDANYTRVRRLAAGGVQPNLNLSIIKAIEVPIPKADLRGELLAERRELDERSRRLKADLAAAQSRGRSLRRSLLAAAFSGRLTTELPQPAESTLAV
jgi:type I restriction enzyme S subunit